MSEKTEEYIKGYEQGVRDFAQNLKIYYGALKGTTYSILVSYNIDEQAQTLIEKAKNNNCPLLLEQDGEKC